MTDNTLASMRKLRPRRWIAALTLVAASIFVTAMLSACESRESIGSSGWKSINANLQAQQFADYYAQQIEWYECG